MEDAERGARGATAPGAEIAALFDAPVTARRLTAPAVPEDILPAEESLVAGAAPRRQADFRNGRVCAHAALADLGIAAAPLAIGARGMPLWPEGIAGSIAHCEGFCAAVVARQAAGLRSLGLDAEVRGAVAPAFAAHVMTAGERAALDALDPALRPDRLALVFSAKEAFYKAQFPLTGLFLDFPEVSVALEGAGFAVRLERPVAGLGPQGARFAGRHALVGRHVVTGLVL